MSARVHEIPRLRALSRRIVLLSAFQRIGGGGGGGEGGEGLGGSEEALLLVDWTEAGGMFMGLLQKVWNTRYWAWFCVLLWCAGA